MKTVQVLFGRVFRMSDDRLLKTLVLGMEGKEQSGQPQIKSKSNVTLIMVDKPQRSYNLLNAIK